MSDPCHRSESLPDGRAVTSQSPSASAAYAPRARRFHVGRSAGWKHPADVRSEDRAHLDPPSGPVEGHPRGRTYLPRLMTAKGIPRFERLNPRKVHPYLIKVLPCPLRCNQSRASDAQQSLFHRPVEHLSVGVSTSASPLAIPGKCLQHNITWRGPGTSSPTNSHTRSVWTLWG